MSERELDARDELWMEQIAEADGDLLCICGHEKREHQRRWPFKCEDCGPDCTGWEEDF